MASYEWRVLARDYGKECSGAHLAREAVALEDEPLYEAPKAGIIQRTLDGEGSGRPASAAVDPLAVDDDPLGGGGGGSGGGGGGDPLNDDPLAVTDPLSDPLSDPLNDPLRSSAAVQSRAGSSALEEDPYAADGFAPWSAKKPKILARYTTTQQIDVDFIEHIPQALMHVDRTQARLEELDGSEDQQKKVLQVSQQEYVAHIVTLHDELKLAWDVEKNRVKALKIAIRCAKVLGDTSVIHFYPSKFVLISEILDTFGQLVFDRIKDRGTTFDRPGGRATKLPDDFTPDMVNAQARETCRNWFYKIASIRELLPRLYVEMAVIHCYKYLYNDPFEVIFERLNKQLRGIGNPLVGTYARAYLARKGYEIRPSLKSFQLTGLCDHFEIIRQHRDADRLAAICRPHGIDVDGYLELYSPALDWLMQCVAHGEKSKHALVTILKQYKETKDALTLNHILCNFHPELIAEHATAFVALINEADDRAFSRANLLTTLGTNLCMHPPAKNVQMPILNEVWKYVSALEDVKEYARLAEVWVEFPTKYLEPKDLNIFLMDIVRHVTVPGAAELVQSELQSIVEKILLAYPDFTHVIRLDQIIPLLDLFTGEHQAQVNKSILRSFRKFANRTGDPVLINTVFDAAKTVHDSINTLSFADERRQVSELLCSFVTKVDYGKDVEKQLNFYSDCRRAFGNFDTVKRQLVLGVCSLAMRTLKLIGGRHTPKTAPFIRACIAFCYITVPSMDKPLVRLDLYLHAGQVALLNGAISQAESLFKGAITLLQEVPSIADVSQATESQIRVAKTRETHLVQFLSHFAATFVLIPGHPELGPFYLVQGLLRVVGEYKWLPGTTSKARVYLAWLAALAALGQQRLPYHVPNLDSNDTLYAGDTMYLEELNSLIDLMVERLLAELTALSKRDSKEAKAAQAELALAYLETTVALADLNPKSGTLAANLFGLAKRNGAPGDKLLAALSALHHRSGNVPATLLRKLTID